MSSLHGCAACREPLDAEMNFCPTCGADQRQPPPARSSMPRWIVPLAVVLAMIPAIVGLGIVLFVIGPDLWHVTSWPKIRVAEAQMASLGAAIDNYRISNKKLPHSLDELTESGPRTPYPYIEKIPLDPWGNYYEYRVLGRNEYAIRSYGEDRLPDTEDDIFYPEAWDEH